MNSRPIDISIYDLAGLGKHYQALGQPDKFDVLYHGRRITLAMAPELYVPILADKQESFIKSEGLQAGFEDIIGPGILTRDGNEWVRDKKLFGSYFHGQLMSSEPAFKRVVDAFIPSLHQDACRNIRLDMSSLTLALSLNTFFSSYDAKPEDFPLEAFETIKSQLSEKALLGPNAPKMDIKVFLNARKEYFSFIKRMVKARKQQTEETLDAVSAMFAYDEYSFSDVVGQTSNLFAASFDTTTAGSLFCLATIAQHTQVQEKLREDINSNLEEGEVTFKTIKQSQYLTAVVYECLRLYPPIWGIFRYAQENHPLQDKGIAENQDIGIVPYLIQRSSKYWAEPEKFMPERFLGTGSKLAGAQTYLPFSKGPRTCIGMGFALLEIKYILARLLTEFRLTPETPLFTEKAGYPFLLLTGKEHYVRFEALHD